MPTTKPFTTPDAVESLRPNVHVFPHVTSFLTR